MRSKHLVVVASGLFMVFTGSACRDSGGSTGKDGGVTPADFAMAGGSGDMAGGGGGGDDAGTQKGDCTDTSTYLQTSIANMRQMLGKSGCYELDNVVLAAPVKPGTAVTFYAQDAAGGDWSAARFNCSTTSTSHPCPQAVHDAAAGIAQGHSVTIKGTYVRSGAVGAIKPEHFYVHSIVDNGAAAMVPKPTQLTQADVVRGQKKEANYYQVVTFTTTDQLKVYDLAPLELAYNNIAGCMKCPCQFGFGMIPAASLKNAAAACTGTNFPTGQMGDPNEIFIGTDYYKTFTISSDCFCAATFKDVLVAPMNSIAKGATVTGVLIFDDEFNNQAVQYQYIAPINVPLTNNALPATGDFPLQAM